MLYDELATYCVEGVSPNPDDGFFGFYMTDGDEIDDLVEFLYPKLGLEVPTRSTPEMLPDMESARHLAVFLQEKLDQRIEPSTA